jgi:hypothetical protein
MPPRLLLLSQSATGPDRRLLVLTSFSSRAITVLDRQPRRGAGLCRGLPEVSPLQPQIIGRIMARRLGDRVPPCR